MALTAWRARIRRADGRICGSGVLVDPFRVLTCAHVIAEALGVDGRGDAPAGAVTVDFPALSGVTRFATVLADAWVPVAADGRGDLAVLVLDESAPEDLAPARLARAGDPGGRTVRTYGHPVGLDDGVWAETRLVAFGGPGDEWVQMDGLAVTGRRVERGFSGAGVFDETTRSVVGLVVLEDLQAPNKVAWMLPMERVVRYLRPTMALLVGVPHQAEPEPRSPPAGVVLERRLSPSEQRDLVDRLRAVPRMRERRARDFYLHAVEQQIDDHLSFERQDDEVLDIWAMAYALLARPGALRVLVKVLIGIYEVSPEVAALEEFVERTFPDLLLEHHERTELERLVEGVPAAWVGAAYRSTTAVYGISASAERVEIVPVIRHLEGFGRLRGGPPPPLVMFVEDLAHKFGGQTSVRLHRWIDGLGARLELDRHGLRRLCDDAECRSTEAGRVYLVVQLQPDSVDADQFLMSAWLQGESYERLLLRDDTPRTIADVAAQLDELLPTVAEHVNVDDELTVEFILPERLIGHPVEEWEFDREKFALPLGIRYAVHVRSLERLRNRASHGTWRRKWRYLAEHGHRREPAHIVCTGSRSSRDPRALYSQLVADDRTVCLAIPFPPPEDRTGARGGDEFTAGFEAGMPVLVWSREPVDPDQFCTLVRDTLAAQGVLDLPRQILWLRRSAMKTMDRTQQSPPHFVPSVGVLWDDADRLPGSFRRSVRFQAPQLGERG